MFFVYILKGENRYYVGHTADLQKRVTEHKTGQVYSTSRMGTMCLVGYFTKENRSEAMQLERMIKKNGHIQHWINHPTLIKV